MRTAKRWVLLAALLLVVCDCSKKQEAAPSPVPGETAKAGAKLAYEHHLRIKLQEKEIAPRMAAVREACESARFGACSERMVVVETGDIDWIEAHDDYAGLHVGSQMHLLRESLHQLTLRLDPRLFLRIHRSAIVRVDRIAELEALANRDCENFAP